jgi:hypothetical protein
MTPEIQLVLFSSTLSLAIAYAWWVKFRVWILREDLFAIRDRLWGTMQELGQLDDPEHRRVRDEINALIRVAPLFSVWTVISIKLEGVKLDFSERDSASCPIQKAREQVVRRLARYLLFQTLSGLLFLVLVSAIIIVAGARHPLRTAIEKFTTVMRQIFGSLQIRDESQQIDEIASSALSNI